MISVFQRFVSCQGYFANIVTSQITTTDRVSISGQVKTVKVSLSVNRVISESRAVLVES